MNLKAESYDDRVGGIGDRGRGDMRRADCSAVSDHLPRHELADQSGLSIDSSALAPISLKNPPR